jgi:UDP-N-acetylmuramate dehydrogenase
MSDLTILQNISLQAYNTLAIDVQTRWFALVSTDEQLQDALEFVQRQYLQEQSSQKQCPLLVLGGGSNVVLVDDFAGLTIVLQTQGIQIENETDEQVFLSVAAGENWHDTVMYCVDKGWYGIENLALIPGSMGAAPIQNIGAYGVELTQILSYVEAIDLASGDVIRLNNTDCLFTYRDSIFKGELKDKVIITRVVLVLSKTPVWSLDYPALQDALRVHDMATLSSHAVANTVINIRNSKLPNPADIPNAGSFFKNPIVSKQCYDRIQHAYPKVVAFPVVSTSSSAKSDGQREPQYKLAAGWLLDQAGWKGKWVNDIAMHSKQALVLTNPNKRSGRELIAFVEGVVEDIHAKYGVYLEVEPRIYTAVSNGELASSIFTPL